MGEVPLLRARVLMGVEVIAAHSQLLELIQREVIEGLVPELLSPSCCTAKVTEIALRSRSNGGEHVV